jgi:putative membrane protein
MTTPGATSTKLDGTAETAVQETAKSVERQSRKVADSAEHLKSSSARMEDSSVRIESSADRTTRLAADRTVLAAERTYAAWVRTGLFALASGIGARALLKGLMPEWLIKLDASLLIAFSIFCFAAAVWRQLNTGAPPPVPDVRRIARPILITLNAFLALVSLAALVGIWSAGP